MDFHIILQLLAGQKASTHLRLHQVIKWNNFSRSNAEAIFLVHYRWGVKGDVCVLREEKGSGGVERRQQSRIEVLISLALINPLAATGRYARENIDTFL